MFEYLKMDMIEYMKYWERFICYIKLRQGDLFAYLTFSINFGTSITVDWTT